MVYVIRVIVYFLGIHNRVFPPALRSERRYYMPTLQHNSLFDNVHLPRYVRLAAIVGIVFVLVFLAANLSTSAATIETSQQPDSAAALPALDPAQAGVGCVEGHKIDDLHVGLPGWVIHAKPVVADEPVLTQVTDGTGYFRFDNLAVGRWLFWEEMQEGWVPVTPIQFEVNVVEGPDCTYVRFQESSGNTQPHTPPQPRCPAHAFRGYVYQQTCEPELVPLGDVLLEAFSSDTADGAEALEQAKQSAADGFWNFVLLPPPAPFYHVRLTVPAGLEVVSATAPEGVVVAARSHSLRRPRLGSVPGQ